MNVEVICVNDSDEAIPDEGRELAISAGFRHVVAPEDTPFLDLIEDLIEEEPIQTPFEYSIVWYPLTDQLPPNMLTTVMEDEGDDEDGEKGS